MNRPKICLIVLIGLFGADVYFHFNFKCLYLSAVELVVLFLFLVFSFSRVFIVAYSVRPWRPDVSDAHG